MKTRLTQNKKFLFLFFAASMMLCVSFSMRRDATKEVKVISFNIRNSSQAATREDGPYCWSNRKMAVLQMIAEEKPDAIGMQEVLPEQLVFLDSALAGYSRIGVGRDDGNMEGECMAIYYNSNRFAIQKSATYWLSSTPEKVSKGWDGACRRTVTVARLKEKKTSQEWLYLNTHLDHVGPVARAEAVKLICRIVNQWDTENSLPVVIGGDMNSSLSDTIFNTLYDNQFLAARQMVNPQDTLATYNAYGKGRSSQIDHFFVKGIIPTSVETLTRSFGVDYISDHYPVAMIFQLHKK